MLGIPQSPTNGDFHYEAVSVMLMPGPERNPEVPFGEARLSDLNHSDIML